MPRLANKGFTGRAPQTAASVPEIPDFSPQLAELPGGAETNAAYQRWWDLVKQRIEFNSGDVNKRLFTLKAQFTGSDASLSAEISEERTVRANADSALASSITTLTATVNGLSATVTTIQSALATAQGYLEARWTLNVTAGLITTGMTLFSASGPDTEVSYIAFQADRFQINTASGGNKVLFSATTTEVKLGNVLTVDLANSKIFIGTGTYGNANTGFYVDSAGNFSLKNKLTFDGTTLAIDGSGTFTGTITASAGSIGGWTIAATTISRNNAILDSAGQLVLGTSNDIVYISATDPTYRIWVGNVTAGSATFRVSKTGVLTATGGVFSGTITSTTGTIGGFALGATSLVLGTGADTVSVGQFPTAYFRIGESTGAGSELNGGQLLLRNADGTTSVSLGPVGGSTGTLRLFGTTGTERIRLQDATLLFDSDTNLYRSSASVLKTDDAFEAASITTAGDVSANELNIVATEVINNSLELVSLKLVLNTSSGVKCDLRFDDHAGADSVFANYMKIQGNGGTIYVPYRTTAP